MPFFCVPFSATFTKIFRLIRTEFAVGYRHLEAFRMKSREDKLAEIRAEVEALKLPPLLSRTWSKPHNDLTKEGGTSIIRIMQWNTLAQALTQGEDNFVKCPSEDLSWDVRKLHLVEEILTYNPSIVCLQEVDRFSYFQSELEEVGYSGLFFEKRYSPCLEFANSTGPDGCAIFYKSSQLELVSSENLNIYVPTDSTAILCNQVALSATFVKTGAMIKQPFHVVTTHLKSKTGYEDLREKQAIYLTRTLKEKLGTEPMIFCGDFNAIPSEPLYSVLERSDLKLKSVYSQLNNPPGEPPYTTWKFRGEGGGLQESCVTIDYIWATEGHFRVENLLKFPSESAIGANRLPSLTYPSDHLSLACDLELNVE